MSHNSANILSRTSDEDYADLKSLGDLFEYLMSH